MADLITHLVTQGIVGFLTMDTAVQHMHKVGGRLSSSILETADIDPKVLLEAVSEFHGLDYASDRLLLSIDPDVPQFWRHDNALRLGAIPLALDATGLTLGVLEPLSNIQLDEVREEYGSKIQQLLLLEFRFFELCNRFFDVVLEHRYAIWASKFPLQEEPDDEDVLKTHPEPLIDDVDTTDSPAIEASSVASTGERTTETTDPVEDHTIETEQTDADELDDPMAAMLDASVILTGRRAPMDLLGSDESFEAAFAPSDDALLLPDNGIAALFEPVSDEPAPEPPRTLAPPEAPDPKDLNLEEAAKEKRRGQEPSMPSIHISSSESKPHIYPSISRHTPSRIETVDESGSYRGREPFPAAQSATQVSGAFRIEPATQRSGLHPLVATGTIAQQLGLADERGSWRATATPLDQLSDQDSAEAEPISSETLREIYQSSERIEELLYSTLSYFGAFFERRFFMHFWQPNRSTGLLMQGVKEHSTSFSRIAVPYDESSGVHKMRNTGNYLQGSPIDIGFLTLYTRLGIPTAKEAVAMPVHINDEVVMTLIIDNGPDANLGASLRPGKVAAVLHELGQALASLAQRRKRDGSPRSPMSTPFKGVPSAERNTDRDIGGPLIPPELLEDVALPPAKSDELELEMDSMQMDPVDIDEEDHRTLDSIDRIFGRDFERALVSEDSSAQTTQGSDSFEIAIGTGQEMSPAAKALLEQDTRRSDQRAVSIIMSDDERSDADLAYDLIPPTPSDLIRPAQYPDREQPKSDKPSEKVSRTTARHHALSGHKHYQTPPGTEDTQAPSDDTSEQNREPKPPKKRVSKSRWGAQDLARLLRVGSAEFSVADESEDKDGALDEDAVRIDTAELPVDPALADTSEQEVDDKLRDTSVHEAVDTLHDTAQQEADEKLQDTAQQETDDKLQDTAQQETDDKLQDTAQQEADDTLHDTAEQEADDKLQDTAEQDTDEKLQDTAEYEKDQPAEDDLQSSGAAAVTPAADAASSAPQASETTATVSEDETSASSSDGTSSTQPADNAPSLDPENLADAPTGDGARIESRTEQAEQSVEDIEPSHGLPPDNAASDDEAPAQESKQAPTEGLHAALQPRKATKLPERTHAKTPFESTAASDAKHTEPAEQRSEPTDPKATQASSPAVETAIETTVDAAIDTAVLPENDDDSSETLMFSPEMVQSETRQQKPAIAPPTPPAISDEVVSVTTDEKPSNTEVSEGKETSEARERSEESREIDLDAVLVEVDQSTASDDIDKIALGLSTELSDTAAKTSSSKASLVRLAELTEQQRRMGTTAFKPLSLRLETLLRGPEKDRADALQELIELPARELPEIHSEFPGPLNVDRTDPQQAQLPLSQHGPLLALVDARLYDFIPQMWACLERRSADARYYALRFLSLIRNLERRFVLVGSALDEDPQIRELALRYIDNFRNSPDFLIALETFRDRIEDPVPHIRIAAIDALVKLQDHDSISLLIETLTDEDEEVRSKAHQGLMRLTFTDCGQVPEAWEKWKALHGRELPEQWLVDAMDAIEPVRRALAARALENISELTVNYHPEMSPHGIMRAKMTVERHFGLRR